MNYTVMPETIASTELVAIEGEPTTPPPEPRELSGVESVILIGAGLVAVGILTWLNENKGRIYSKQLDDQTNNSNNQR